MTSTHWTLTGHFLKHLEGLHFHVQPRLEKKVIPVGGLQAYIEATYDSEAPILMVSLCDCLACIKENLNRTF